MSEQKKKQSIPGFRLVGKLGAGGMGAVYKAVQESLDREVAVKVMPVELAENPEFRERFYREAKAAGRLNHPNVVQGIDAGEAGKHCWIAMEYVDGPSVADLLKEKGPFPEDEALAIVTDIARALQHAADHGIIHRDVKPENFLRTKSGVTKLCDLGIAKAAAEDTGLTQEGRAVGTPRYISPEQARGDDDIDARTDIYSLGASWYHLLTGEPPFDGATAAVVMTKHITDEPEPIADKVDGVNAQTVRVIQKMMAKNRDDRYASAADLLADLEALAKGEIARGALPVGPGSRGKKRRTTEAAEKPAARSRDAGKTREKTKPRDGARTPRPTRETGAHTPARGGREARSGRAGRSGRGREAADPPVMVYVGVAVGVLVLVGILVAVLKGDGKPDRRVPPPPPTREHPPPPADGSGPSAAASGSDRSGDDAPARPAGGDDAGDDGASPEPSAASADRQAKADKAWKKLQRKLDREPPAFHPDLYERFAEKWKGTAAGDRADAELEKIDAKLRTMKRRRIQEDFERLVQQDYGRYHDFEEAAEAFLRNYPDAPQAEKVRRMLVEHREERRR